MESRGGKLPLSATGGATARPFPPRGCPALPPSGRSPAAEGENGRRGVGTGPRGASGRRERGRGQDPALTPAVEIELEIGAGVGTGGDRGRRRRPVDSV